MPLDNLSDLEPAIAEWLFRKGDAALAARAGDFIALFEADFLIDPEQRTAEMQSIATCDIEQAAIALPDNYIDMVRLKVLGTDTAPEQKLTYVTPDLAADLDRHSERPTGNSAAARHYTIIAGQIVITPQRWAPIGGSLEMVYNAFQPLATADGGVNWLLTKYPNLYLYGSLMQAAAYIDDDSSITRWKAGRDEAMAKLALTEKKRRLGAGPLTMRPSSTSFR